MSSEPATLEHVCNDQLLNPKYLVTPSLQIGSQWIESLVRNDHAVVNLRPTTVIGLARKISEVELAENGLTMTGRSVASLFVHSAWGQLPSNGYLGRLEPSTALSDTVCAVLMELRQCGVAGSDLEDHQFESKSKTTDLRFLLEAYTEFLSEHSLVDSADVLRRAIDRLATTPFEPDSLVLISQDTDARGLELQLLNALSDDQRIEILHPVASPHRGKADEAEVTREPAAQFPQVDEPSVRFFRSIGEANEIREVLRLCLAGKVPLDDVEILHTDASTYVPLVRSLFERYALSVPDHSEIPATYSEGLPASLSRPGQALSRWLAWIIAGFPQRLLIEMISDGLLICSTKAEFGSGYLARLLRPLAIGTGRENYLPCIDTAIKSANHRLEILQQSQGPEVQASCNRKLSALRLLRRVTSRLLELSEPVSDSAGSQQTTAVETFLDECARCVDEFDRQARASLLNAVQERLLLQERLHDESDSREWLINLASQTRVLTSGPRPGHIHVANVGDGGHSGRKHTFIVGLDDSRFPGASLQDPILLDKERARIHPDLESSTARLRRKMDALQSTLKRLTGTVTLSWSCYSIADDRETFPSPAVLDVWRSSTGDQEASLESVCQAVGRPVSFGPDDVAKSLDEAEVWMWKLTEENQRPSDRIQLVESHYEHLAAGAIAAQQRQTAFGRFNGCVPAAGVDLNPCSEDGLVLSATTLEKVGSCPLAFFFQKGLGLKPVDEFELDFDQWLEPSDIGSLMHEVFRRFLEELSAEEKTPLFDRDHSRLAEHLHNTIQEWRLRIPSPSESAFRTTCWKLIRASQVFLRNEESFCRSSQPRFFEVALGRKGPGEATLLDDLKPVAINLPDGTSILSHGQVDRVDQIGPTSYSVWDYKLGSVYGYLASDPFRQGRRVQSLLYLKMINSALRRVYGPDVHVDRFGYFFPGSRAHGLRIDWGHESLDSGHETLQRLCGIIKAGAFLATDTDDDCKFCDYKSICRDLKQVTGHSKSLLNREDESMVQLTDFRRLRRG